MTTPVFTRTAWALAAALLLTSASEASDWTTKWSNGFKLESEDGEFKLKFGGRIQADYTSVSADGPAAGIVDGDGFEFRRARLFFEGTIYRNVKFKAQYDFAGGDADFKDVWIGLKTGAGELRFGHSKEYFSLEELTSSKYLAFLERSLPNAFAPGRNAGIGYHAASGDKLNWGAGWYYDADDFGVSSDEDNTNLTGRIAFRPIYEEKGKRMLHVGLSATQKDRASSIRFSARPEAHFTGRFVDTGTFAADGATIFGLELAGVFDRTWFAGEYISADVDAPGFGDPSFSGYYAQVGYSLTGEHRRYKTSSGAFDRQKPGTNWNGQGGRGAWEIALRASSIDLSDQGIDGGEMDNLTLGLNWYLNPATRLMLNYVTADAGARGNADFILMRWQVDF